MRTPGILLAFALLTVAVPMAAPTASAYCLSTFCPPLCIVCIIVTQEANSAHCLVSTDGATTAVDCGSWLTGDKPASVNLPVPTVAGSYWVSVGPYEHVSYGYALP